MKFPITLLIASAAAKHRHSLEFIATEEQLSALSEAKLVVSLRTTLDQALELESRNDTAGAVAKTAAIKNI